MDNKYVAPLLLACIGSAVLAVYATFLFQDDIDLSRRRWWFVHCLAVCAISMLGGALLICWRAKHADKAHGFRSVREGSREDDDLDNQEKRTRFSIKPDEDSFQDTSEEDDEGSLSRNNTSRMSAIQVQHQMTQTKPAKLRATAPMKTIAKNRETYMWILDTILNGGKRTKELYQLQHLQTRLSLRIDTFERAVLQKPDFWTAVQQLHRVRTEFQSHADAQEESASRSGCWGPSKSLLSQALHALDAAVIEHFFKWEKLDCGDAFMPTDGRQARALNEFRLHLQQVAKDTLDTIEKLRKETGQTRRKSQDDIDMESSVDETHKSMHQKVKDKLFLKKTEGKYPGWWSSALCKMMQLEICDVLNDQKYGILKSILKVADSPKLDPAESPDEKLFDWTEFPVVLLQQHFHSGLMETQPYKKPDDAKTEFTVRLNEIWFSVVPDFLCELMQLQAILESQLSTAGKLKVGGLMATAIPAMWPFVRSFEKSHAAILLDHYQRIANATAGLR